MGNSSSTIGSKEVDYKTYTQSPWRSQRAIELDALGGLARPALALGQSFNAKMQFLGEQLLEQGDKMQEILAPQSSIKEAVKKQSQAVGYLRTDKRAAERKGETLPEPPARTSGGGAAQRRFLSQAEYQKARKAAKTAAVEKEAKMQRPVAGPAEWRVRTHNARRNALLMVKTMLYLKRGHKHPKRMLRFSGLGFYIPQLLAEDCERFVGEQLRYGEVRSNIAASRAELDELLRSSAAEAPLVTHPDSKPDTVVLKGVLKEPATQPSQNSKDTERVKIAPVEVTGPGAVQHSTSLQHESQLTARRSSGNAVGTGARPSQLFGAQTAFDDVGAIAMQRRSRSLERERISSLPSVITGEVAGQGSAAEQETASRQLRGALSDLPDRRTTDTDSHPARLLAVIREAAPVKLPSVTQNNSPARRSPAPGDRPSGGGSLGAILSPPRRPWGAASTVSRANSMQARSGVNTKAGEDRARVLSAGTRRVNRQYSMPVMTQADAAAAAERSGMLPAIQAHKDGVEVLAESGQAPTASQALANTAAIEQAESVPRPVSRYTRMTQIRLELDKQYDLLKRSSKLMGMYTNRVNGAWAESQQWDAPSVSSGSDVASWIKGDHYNVYKADVIRQLRLGQVGVQLLVGEDAFTVPAKGQGGKSAVEQAGASQQDLWTADLWELIEAVRPGILPATARIEGLSMCARALCTLVLATQALAGKDSVERLHVILHVNEEQEEELVEELHMHRCYGLNRANVIIVVGTRHPGYRWDSQEALFTAESSLAASWASGSPLAATASGQHPFLAGLGSGAALCQLAWAGESFTLGEDGTPTPLSVPIFDRLEAKKIDWLVSRRARDLGLLTREGILDVNLLAYSMYLRDKSRASCVMEVVHADSAVTARLHDSIVLHPSCKDGPDTSRLVTELRQAEVVSGPVISAVEKLRTAPGSKGLALGLSRYLLHVPSIKGMLTSLAIFRPRLSVTRHLLHVSLDVADLHVHEKGRTLAVEARTSPGLLATQTSLEALLPLLQAQDHDPAFRDMVLTLVPQGAKNSEVPTVVAGTRSKPGHPIVVFLASNQVAAAAVNAAANLARAGRDNIQLVHIVSGDLQKTAAEEMLEGFKRQAMRSMAEVTTHVLVRKTSGLLECMERFVADSGAEAGSRPLVVMGSIQLTSNVFSYMANSVALSAVKRLAGTPVLLVTLNSKQIPPRPGMRCMALVEPHSRNMLTWMCKSMVEHGRGDRLVLCQVQPSPHITRQQAAGMRRLMENFHTLSFSHQTPVHKEVSGEGPVESTLCGLVEEHGIGVLALQLPPGTKVIPQHMLSMMRSCRGATLIYQESGMRQSALRRSMSVRQSIGLLSQGHA